MSCETVPTGAKGYHSGDRERGRDYAFPHGSEATWVTTGRSLASRPRTKGLHPHDQVETRKQGVPPAEGRHARL